MPTPIYRRIQHELRFRPLSMEELAEDLDVPVVTIDMLDPDKDLELLRRIADILEIRTSDLIRESGNMRAFSQEYLIEVWPNYEDRLDMTREDAWERIESSIQYRGNYSNVKNDVDLILDGLSPPSRSRIPLSCTTYLLGECGNGCIVRCIVTGRPLGA